MTNLDNILKIKKNLSEQDNRLTKDPMFCVQKCVRDVGYSPDYAEDTVWINMESGEYEEVEPDAQGAEEFGYIIRWETVMVCFTEQGCKDYLEKNGHNISHGAYQGQVRIFVESFNRCSEMQSIRDFLLQLNGKGKTK